MGTFRAMLLSPATRGQDRSTPSGLRKYVGVGLLRRVLNFKYPLYFSVAVFYRIPTTTAWVSPSHDHVPHQTSLEEQAAFYTMRQISCSPLFVSKHHSGLSSQTACLLSPTGGHLFNIPDTLKTLFLIFPDPQTYVHLTHGPIWTPLALLHHI